MLYRLFHTEYRLQLIYCFLLALVLALPDVFHAVEGHWMFVPNGFTVLFSKLLIFGAGFLLSRLLYSYSLIKAQSFFPSFALIVFADLPGRSIDALAQGYEAFLVIVLLLLIFQLYKREHPEDVLFFVSMLLSLLSLSAPGLFLVLPALWFTMLVFNIYALRDYLNTVIGFAVPWFFVWAWYYFTDQPQAFSDLAEPGLSFSAWKSIPLMGYLSSVVILLFTALPGMMKVFSRMFEKVISYRKYTWAIFWFFIVPFIAFFVSTETLRPNINLIILINGSIFFSMGIFLLKKAFWVDVFFSFLFFCLLALKYGGMFYGLNS